jgi:hypothetical protein
MSLGEVCNFARRLQCDFTRQTMNLSRPNFLAAQFYGVLAPLGLSICFTFELASPRSCSSRSARRSAIGTTCAPDNLVLVDCHRHLRASLECRGESEGKSSEHENLRHISLRLPHTQLGSWLVLIANRTLPPIGPTSNFVDTDRKKRSVRSCVHTAQAVARRVVRLDRLSGSPGARGCPGHSRGFCLGTGKLHVTGLDEQDYYASVGSLGAFGQVDRRPGFSPRRIHPQLTRIRINHFVEFIADKNAQNSQVNVMTATDVHIVGSSAHNELHAVCTLAEDGQQAKRQRVR